MSSNSHYIIRYHVPLDKSKFFSRPSKIATVTPGRDATLKNSGDYYNFYSGVNYKRYHVSMLLIRRARSLLRRRHRSMTIVHNAIPISQKPSKPPRKPARSGQNLSERYKRLENAVRGREALTRSLEVLSKTTPTQGRPASTAIPTFHGFRVPQEPNPPADDGILLFFVLLSSKKVTRLVRMLHVRLCHLRIRPLRRISCSLPGCCRHLASISDCYESA
jgi:hypothetical protein